MFGWGREKEDPKLAEARRRIQRIEKQKAGLLGKGETGDEPDVEPYGFTVTVGYAFAIALGFVLTFCTMRFNGLDFHTGLSGLDSLMFSSGLPNITGNATADMVVIPVLRGTIIFLLLGLWPLLSLLWVRLIDKPNANPYLSIWGVGIGLPLICYFCRDYFFPLLGQVTDIIMH